MSHAFKKNLLRLTQQVNEKVDKSTTKTQELSPELVEVEENVQKLKTVYTSALKKANDSLPSYKGPDNLDDSEKRTKKQVTWGLGNALLEGCNVVDDSHFLHGSLQHCGGTMVLIAKNYVRFELDFQEQVISPMSKVLSEIRDIDAHRRKLSKARLDLDGANGALRRKEKRPGGEADPQHAQLVAAKETAENQFHMAQDTYITALLSFSSKEREHSQPLEGLLSCYQKLYEDVGGILRQNLPTLQSKFEKANTPVFGTDLEKHLEITGRPIASVLHKCCSSLLRSGVEQPGIFRLAGGLPQLRKLKAMFDSNRMEEEEWEQDVYTLGQAIKMYLRELPEPLLTFAMFDDWLACVSMSRAPDRLARCKELIEKLPTPFLTNLQYLIWFLSQVAAKEAQNKMGASNLGLVLGPNILRKAAEEDGESITALNASSTLVELMINHYPVLFPDALPAEALPRPSPARSMTVSGPMVGSAAAAAGVTITPARGSVRTHKKGKAPTPLKRMGAPAPTPPPRHDLDKTASSPAMVASREASPVQDLKSPSWATKTPSPKTSVSKTPVSSPKLAAASPKPPVIALNPFGDDDDDEDSEWEERARQPSNENEKVVDRTNPFNSPEDSFSLEETLRNTAPAPAPEPCLNPFGDSEEEEDEEERQASPPPSATPRQPEAKPQPPRPPASPVVREDAVTISATTSPSFTRGTHSRNASNTSTHSRNASTGSDKPTPPPRFSLEQ